MLRSSLRRTCIALLALATIALGPGKPALADVQPGDLITKVNAEKVRDLVSPGIMWNVLNGMDLAIIPYKRIVLPVAFREATEKYYDQVSLDERDDITNWVAGWPFPVIDPNDARAAQKIMYNRERTHYFTDDLNLHLIDAETGAMDFKANGDARYRVERHFVAEWLRLIQMAGRLHHEPKPAFTNNADETFRKSGLFPLIEPFDLKGVGGMTYRYLDRVKHDDTWLYIPVLRRVRRLSSAQRSDALFGQDIDVDSYGGYAGQIPWFTWKLLGEKPMLASFHGEKFPATPCIGDGGATFCEPWEVRPSVFIIEGTPIVKNYSFSKRIIFVDKETYFIPYGDMYDQNGEIWKVVLQSIRTSTKPNPQADYTYDEARMFIYAFTMVDMQLRHATRASIPGLAFPDEPGWYVDVGEHGYGAVSQDWFQVSTLITLGR